MAASPELNELEDQLRQGQWSKWLRYQRLSLNLTDDDQKIALAQEILAMPGFGVFQCMSEHHWYKLRHPTKTGLETLEDQLREEPVKWLSYRRRSLGMKTTAEKIEVAQAVLAMAPFGWAAEKFEKMWLERNRAKDVT
jgi:hypothetical protein